jgi:hypothetical protein
MQVNLEIGDVFLTENSAFLGDIINFWQKLESHDDKSVYSHAGIILSKDGQTFEALNTGIKQSALSKRVGQKVLIARPVHEVEAPFWDISEFCKVRAIDQLLRDYDGRIYPYWRIAFQLIPFASKYISAHGKFLVCSELVAKYLSLIGARYEHYLGATPDDLHDEWRFWKNFDIIYEGVYAE